MSCFIRIHLESLHSYWVCNDMSEQEVHAFLNVSFLKKECWQIFSFLKFGIFMSFALLKMLTCSLESQELVSFLVKIHLLPGT